GHHDAELRLDGLDHCVVVGLRIFALFLRRSEERHGLFWNHRQPELGGPARHHALHAIAERHDPYARLLRLSDDVRHHHAGADHWRIHQSHHLQGLHAVSDSLADLGLFSFCPHGVGRRYAGAVAGLATITPAAGYVSPATAVIIGTVAGVVCYYACALKNRLRWDDALDVWGVHGVGGFLGIILLGVFASTAWNPTANGGVNGLLAGDPSFFLKQLAAGLFSSVWALIF